ncbi:uncharacterized protein LOC125587219 [Brassica napus]|uniref:uncharacterized protein LOC125587219 n=1 Tax=Brassica napus TaxID=3708 RepID=UPI00207A2551|nr:uncharacterized protein LOC125587219 [Brassica napus]
MQQSTPRINAISKQIQPQKDEILEISIDEADQRKVIRVVAFLSDEIQRAIIDFLKKNMSTFAWTTSDMNGINPTITSHKLNVDPTIKPIRQKRCKLGPERSKAVNEEVERLLAAGSIAEVRYPEWLANPVAVKKNNGKWRVCVDLTNLNNACPKDSYPLLHIDQLVETTAGNELLTFMNAFSGYNQIMMHPDDREKTAFITGRGTYCYKVIPFGLKNAGVTYQRVINRMFANKLGNTMEVYIDGMLVKSLRAADHLNHLRECFKMLNEYGMKLNPAKCTFRVTSGEFLGYIVTQRGIGANHTQITAILDLPSPKNRREVRRLTGKIAALNRFISRSTDKCLPFYELLRGNKRFVWDEKCEEAFGQLKQYLMTPLVVSKPEAGDTLSLSLYITASSTAVSSALIREYRGEQKPIVCTSKRMTDQETRYPTLEKMALVVITSARKLRPYFQSHTIEVLTIQPLRTSPTGELIRQSLSFGFTASHNEGEYESLIAGLRPAKAVKAKRLSTYCDSQLITSQFSGDYDARNKRMDAYLKVVQTLAKDFEFFELTKVPRGENVCADALFALGNRRRHQVKRTIPIHKIDKPSIELTSEGMTIVAAISEAVPMEDDSATEQIDTPDWRTDFIDYLVDLPPEKWIARRLKTRSAHNVVLDGELHRWTATKVLLKCIHGEETRLVMAETHECAAGNRSGGRALALKVKSLGFYWPTMNTEALADNDGSVPFHAMGNGHNRVYASSRHKGFVLVLTDYFKKWIEAEAFANITEKEVQGFVWKNIICRHGLPYEIVTDNGSQFISNKFQKFCERWRIRLNTSSPRYPQSNCQAEASNKIIIDGLKKRLDLKKGCWADELDGVLWSHRTTPRGATKSTPFSMAHGVEAMAPAEVNVTSLR